MTTYSTTPASERGNGPAFGMGKFLFVVVLAVVFFVLAQSMVRHRFCAGRRVDHLTPQAPVHIGP